MKKVAKEKRIFEEQIARMAKSVVDRRMSPAAVFLLELHKPIFPLVKTGLVMSAPLFAPLVGVQRIEVLQQLVESKENIEMLIVAIEELEQKRRLKSEVRCSE